MVIEHQKFIPFFQFIFEFKENDPGIIPESSYHKLTYAFLLRAHIQKCSPLLIIFIVL